MTKPLTVEQLRCLELSAIIREGLEGVRFDMNFCRCRGCDPAGCIAGHAVAVYAARIWETPRTQWEIWNEGARLLQLTSIQAKQLFAPWQIWEGLEPDDITPAMAASVLANFAMTGKVEWPAS